MKDSITLHRRILLPYQDLPTNCVLSSDRGFYESLICVYPLNLAGLYETFYCELLLLPKTPFFILHLAQTVLSLLQRTKLFFFRLFACTLDPSEKGLFLKKKFAT